jgi:Tfp pilus assembly protein PilN
MGIRSLNHSANGSFLPPEYVKNKSQVRANFFALMLFTLVMAGVIGAFVVNHQRWRKVHAEAEIISALFAEEASKIEQLKGLESQRAELLDRAEVITALIDRVPRSVLMAEIVRELPDGIVLTLVGLEGQRARPPAPPADPKARGKAPATRSIAIKGAAAATPAKAEPERVAPPRFTHTVTVEGLSTANEKIADYLGVLKASPLFSDVELALITGTVVEEVGYRRFKMTMNLREQANARQVAGVKEFGLQTDTSVTNVNPASQSPIND